MKVLVALLVFLIGYIPVSTLPAKTQRPYFPTVTNGRVLESRSVTLPVFLYHYVREIPEGDAAGAALSITPANFIKHITFLLAQGYTPVSTETLARALAGTASLPERPVMLTFDDGTKDFATTVFPILSAYGVPATVFVVSGFVGTPNYLSWDDLKSVARSPLITIGAHGLNHVSLTALPTPIADRQIVLSRNILRVTTRQKVDVLAYPNGAFNDGVVRRVAETGYDLAFTTVRGTTHTSDRRFELPRIRPGGSVESLRRALETR